MEYKTLPLGTVVRINEAKAVIVGYDFVETGTKLSREYLVLPYPKGYASPKDLKLVSDRAFEVIHRGYENEQYNAVALWVDSIERSAQQMNVDELKKAILESTN